MSSRKQLRIHIHNLKYDYNNDHNHHDHIDDLISICHQYRSS
jgi:hypothetical protein